MSPSSAPLRGSALSVVREIDRELERLDKQEKALVSQRTLLISARAVLSSDGRPGRGLRRRISHREIGAYLREHPGSSADHIAEALQAAATVVSTQLHHGKHTRYVSRNNGWYVRSRSA